MCLDKNAKLRVPWLRLNKNIIYARKGCKCSPFPLPLIRRQNAAGGHGETAGPLAGAKRGGGDRVGVIGEGIRGIVKSAVRLAVKEVGFQVRRGGGAQRIGVRGIRVVIDHISFEGTTDGLEGRLGNGIVGAQTAAQDIRQEYDRGHDAEDPYHHHDLHQRKSASGCCHNVLRIARFKRSPFKATRIVSAAG